MEAKAKKQRAHQQKKILFELGKLAGDSVEQRRCVSRPASIIAYRLNILGGLVLEDQGLLAMHRKNSLIDSGSMRGSKVANYQITLGSPSPRCLLAHNILYGKHIWVGRGVRYRGIRSAIS